MTKRKQKNLRLDEEYHDKLENLAEEWFNSKKKQGQVVEKLLDIHGDNDIIGMISDIHNEVVTDNSQIDTHTEESDSISTAEEIETKVENDEYIDLNEYELSEVKDSRSVDKALIFGTIAQQQSDKIGFDKSYIRKMIVKEANYGYNGANEIAGSILARFAIELPDVVGQYESMVNVNKSINDYLQTEVDISSYVWTVEEKEQLINENVENLIQGSSPSQSNLTNDIVQWYRKQVDFVIDAGRNSIDDEVEKTKYDKEIEAGDYYIIDIVQDEFDSRTHNFDDLVIQIDNQMNTRNGDEIRESILEEVEHHPKFEILEENNIKYVEVN
jgi:hypothetical protein